MIKPKYYTFALHKAYFDRGYSITNYIKYGIALFGISSLNVKATMIIAACYAVLCYVVGVVWYHKGLVMAEAEVGNQYNLFQKQMREKFK